jgi:chitinase
MSRSLLLLLTVACSFAFAAGCGSNSASSAADAGTDAIASDDATSPGEDGSGPGPDGAASPDDGSTVVPPGDAGTPPTDAASDSGIVVDGGTSTTGQWVLGYYVGYQINDLPVAQIDWTGLTHIAFAPLTVKSDHSLDLSFDDSNGTGSADAMALAQAAHAHGVKALLMLGGAGAGGNIASAASAANRAGFVSTLTNALTTLGYDGIDLDWEDGVNLDDLVSLAQALRAARPGIVLSYPAGAINGNYQTVDSRMATLATSLDRFNVQTYYPSTAVAGSGWDSWFNSPLSGVTGSTPIAIDDTLDRYAQAGIPRAKLGMGMSFYAICYTGGITGPRQPTNGSSQTVTGGDNNYPLSAFFAVGSTFDGSQAASRKVDAVAQVPYLSLPTAVSDAHCNGSTQYISYDDETSIAAKGTFSKTKGYGGIIVWTIQEGWLPQNASGGRARNALMQALKHGFIDP